MEGQYTKAEKTEYTAGGWLVDYRFRGRYADDLTVITPAGPCAPTPRYFIVGGGYITYRYCTNTSRAQALCESQGSHPGLPVPNSPYGLCGHKATLNVTNTFVLFCVR